MTIDKTEKEALKEAVKEEVDIAFLKVRYWLVLTVLACGVTAGAPALITGSLYYAQLETTTKLAQRNQERLDSRTNFINSASAQIKHMQDYLNKEHGYEPPEELPSYE